MSLWAKYFVVVLVAPMVLFVAARPRRAQVPGDAGALCRGRRGARRDGAASGLAGATTISCRSPMPSTAPCCRAAGTTTLASAAIRRRPVVLPAAVAADRGAAVLPRRSAAKRRPARRPTPSTAASSPGSPSARRRRCWLLSAVSGRGTVAMWGYPLWLFLGLWLVMTRAAARSTRRGWRASSSTWAIVFACLAIAFIVNYAVLPRFDHRYRAVFFPGRARWPRNRRSAIAPRPASRSPM